MVRREHPELAELLEKFVAVRAVQMWGVDLDRFQFDANLTWSAIFMNADGTIYGRYGTRAPEGAMAAMSMQGLIEAMKGALELHSAHPADRERLAGKAGSPLPWKSAEQLPGHRGRFVEGDTSRRGCVHCHFVDEGIAKSYWLEQKPVGDELLWKYPMPDLLGLSLDREQRATVRSVTEGSEAAAAGFEVGDRITTLGGQPLLSIADVQWVLHRATAPATLAATVERRGQTLELSLSLPVDWRRRGELKAGTARGLRPGLHAVELTPELRAAAELKDDELGLLVKGVHEEWGVVAGRPFDSVRAGVLKNDIIVAIDGDRTPRNTSEFLAWFWQNTRPGQKVTVTVLRRGEPMDIEIHMP